MTKSFAYSSTAENSVFQDWVLIAQCHAEGQTAKPFTPRILSEEIRVLM